MNPNVTRTLRPILALVAAIGLSACASNVPDSLEIDFDATSRAAPVGTAVGNAIDANPRAGDVAVLSDVNVIAVNVNVPATLSVSEANRYYPGGDIVWREDPMGNRHEQVQTIVKAALEKGVAGLSGSRDVELDVVVSRFHALTEKARYTVGGVHAIQFTLQVRDAETGVILSGPKKIVADFDALGGRAAIQAEANGNTQKVRITNHLAHVILQELTQVNGFTAYDTGLMGAINRL